MSDKKRIVVFICALIVCNITIVVALFFGCASFPSMAKHILAQAIRSLGYPLPETDKYTRQGQEQIITDATRVLSAFPGNKDILQLRAEALSLHGDYESSLKDYDRLANIDPQNPKWYEEKAAQLIALDRDQEALEAHQQLIKLQGKNMNNLVLRARDYFELHQKQNAVQDLVESEHLKMDSVAKAAIPEESFNLYINPQYKRAQLYQEMGMSDKYLAYLTMIIDDKKTSEDDRLTLLQERATAYVNQGNFARALADYDAKIAVVEAAAKADKYLNYRSPSDVAERANVLLVLGKTQEAKAGYKKRISDLSNELNEKYIDFASEAELLRWCKRLDDEQSLQRLAPKCLAVAEKNLSTNQKNSEVDISPTSDVFDLIKRLPPEMGKTLALEALARPSKQTGYDGYEDLYYYLHDLNGARAFAATAKTTKDSHYYHRWASRELEIGNTNEAMRLAKKSVDMDAAMRCGQSTLASVLIATGSFKEAQKHLALISPQDLQSDDYFMLYQIAKSQRRAADADKWLRRAAALDDGDAIEILLKTDDQHKSSATMAK